MKKWTIDDARELYNINGWGTSYFGINDKGNVYVTPCKDDTQIDIREVMDELSLRDVTPPVLLRFPDILELGHLVQHVVLNLAEALFAQFGEELRNGLAPTALYIPVKIVEGDAQLFRESLPHRGLAGSHVADEDDSVHSISPLS